MAAGVYNLTGSSLIERGSCYSFAADLNFSTGEFVLTDYSLSGFTYRKWDEAPGPNFNYNIITPESGVINFSFSASQTREFSLDPYRYEVYLYPPSGGCPLRILQGDIQVQGGNAP